MNPSQVNRPSAQPAANDRALLCEACREIDRGQLVAQPNLQLATAKNEFAASEFLRLRSLTLREQLAIKSPHVP
jgi:hypothetical protein